MSAVVGGSSVSVCVHTYDYFGSYGFIWSSVSLANITLWFTSLQACYYELWVWRIHRSFIHPIAMCTMWQFLAVLNSFFHSSLLYTFSLPLFSTNYSSNLPPLHLVIYFLVYLLVLLFPNSYTILFWEFYFLPLSVHVQTNTIYVALLSLLWWVS
jgi:hypothetical protein